jgi:endoglucanase
MPTTSLNLDLLKRLCELPGVAGREDALIGVVREELTPLVDEVSVDALGNVIGVRRGSGGPRVMLAAHTDEIGFLVKHIDERGFLRVQPVGGFDPRKLAAQRVIVHGFGGQLRGVMDIAVRPFITADPGAIKPPSIDELYVDLGMRGDDVRAQVEVGDMVTMDRTLEQAGEVVISKALDDRVGVFIMLETLRALGPTQCEIVAVATTQEEVGLRGAGAAAHRVAPDIAIALDITPALDTPGALPEDAITRLGEGVGVKVMDMSTISDHQLLKRLRQLAHEHDIPSQLEILPRGGTDAGAMQRAHGGAPAITLSIPTRHAHTVNEMCALSDIRATIDLLTVFLERAHETGV